MFSLSEPFEASPWVHKVLAFVLTTETELASKLMCSYDRPGTKQGLCDDSLAQLLYFLPTIPMCVLGYTRIYTNIQSRIQLTITTTLGRVLALLSCTAQIGLCVQ